VRRDVRGKDLKACIAETLEIPAGSYNLHIASMTGKAVDKFAVKDDWTYTISTKARQAQPAPIPGDKRVQVYLKGGGKEERLVEANRDRNEKEAIDEFKRMLKAHELPPEPAGAILDDPRLPLRTGNHERAGTRRGVRCVAGRASCETAARPAPLLEPSSQPRL
jgi:hypothetical protein